MTIKDLEPKVVWNNFYGLTQIPRPSKHEEKVEEYLYNWGVSHGFDTTKDETGNIIIRLPATPGYENRRGVIFQGHMDMVPQKTADTVHDFLKDPIKTKIVDGWVGAEGTTLGADNGIGVAIGLAVLEDPTVKHGPVEVLVTYDEETGMTGAEMLEPGVLKGDILINLDSEEEGELCIGCAGGLDAVAEFKYEEQAVPAGYKGIRFTVKGLQGGHSGMDISLYRANANKIASRILLPLMEQFGAEVADFTGGSLRNAIPFEASVLVAVPEARAEAAKEKIREVFAEAKTEYRESDPSAVLYVDDVDTPATCIAHEVILKAVKTIIACPSGVIRMSQTMPGLTETSVNLAIVRTADGIIRIASLLRSSVDSAKADLAERFRCIFDLAGASVRFEGGYSGWVPRPDTPMNQIMKDVWKQLFGEEMKVRATHGGLECALLGAKYPSWEMVSVGPTIVHPHSPDERVKIDSVGKVWEYVKAVLEAVPEK